MQEICQQLRGLNPAAWLTETPAETVAELIELFYQSPHFQSCGQSWQQIMRYHLDGHVKDRLGNLRFPELTRDKIYTFYLELKNKHGLSHSSIQKYHLKLCFLGDIFVERHPDKLNTPRQIKDFLKRFPRQEPRREINFLTYEEIEKVLTELRKTTSDLAYPFTKLLVYTGMRRDEARNLKWTDIDVESGFIHIRKSKNGKSRSIPIEPGAMEAINEMPRRSEFIFVHEDGLRPDKYSLRRPFQIRAGWGLKKVSLLLGHSDISLTARVYTHLLDGDLKVQDDFRFDKSPRKQNSEVQPAEKMDAVTIMAMIQMLQQQLAQTQNRETVTTPFDSTNNSENLRTTAIASTIALEKTPLCDAGATGQKKRPHVNVTLSSAKSENTFLIQKIENGRGDTIRTCDPLHPMQVR